MEKQVQQQKHHVHTGRKREEEERLAAEAAEKLALEAQAEAEKQISLNSFIRAGWRRYVLVSVVLALTVYNVALFIGNGDKSQ